MSAMDTIPPPLNQGWGYGVLVGIGLAFAAFMYAVTRLLLRFNGEDPNKFEEYVVAGRRIGIGLTATAVISSWAWSTALLSSAQSAYNFGIAGSFWFAAGCVVQIAFFALLAIQSKKKTPHAHTILEVVKARYGVFAHFLYMVLCLLTNLIASVNMLLGASATISTLTGMNIIASTFLIPVTVTMYTISGGLRAVVITDLLHTVSLLTIALYICFKTLSNPEVGGIDGIYDRVKALAAVSPVAGNANGSYLTMSSRNALAFATVHSLGNWGLVAMDSSYWAKAYSADVAAAAPGYIIGGLLYFAIPWGLGTTVGIAALSLGNSPIWPAAGRMLNMKESNDGLALAYTAVATCGRSAGAIAVIFIIFFAVTSTTSAQLISVSSIVGSDIYHTYLRPNASERSVILVSRLACIGFALIACAVSVAFNQINLSLTWTLYFLGVVTTPASITIVLTVVWRRQTWAAAVFSPIIGLGAGLLAWLLTSKHYGNGVINVETTGNLISCMYGNITSFFVPVILSPLISYLRPDRVQFDWERFNGIRLIDDADDSSSTLASDEKKRGYDAGLEEAHATVLSGPPNPASRRRGTTFSDAELRYMDRMSKLSGFTGAFIFLVVWVLWPFGMYATYSDLSKRSFRGWIIVSLIWLVATLVFVAFVPAIEGRHVLGRIARGLLGKQQPEAPRGRDVHRGPHSAQPASNDGAAAGYRNHAKNHQLGDDDVIEHPGVEPVSSLDAHKQPSGSSP